MQVSDIKDQIKTPWGEIGYITFKRTYSRRLKEDDPSSKTEEFWQVVQRELDASDKQLKVGFSEEEKEEYARLRLGLKFSVAGRFMWQLGTKTVDKLGLPSLQNCFRRDTEFVTTEGIKSFYDFQDGDEVIIKGNTSWKKAVVRNYGEQELFKLTVRRGSRIEEIFTTENHRWIIGNKHGKKQSIKTTVNLESGMILQQTALKTNLHNIKMCNVGQQHGLVFGDGHYNKNAKCCAFVPCGDSIEEYKKVFNFNGGTKEITGLPNTWKSIPSFEMNKHYIYGFLAGWFAADGYISKDGSMTLSNKSKEVLLQAKGLFAKLDIYCGEIKLSRDINPFDGSDSTLYRMSINRDNLSSDFLILSKHKKRFDSYNNPQHYKVVSVERTSIKEDVWCISEPEKEEFTLANGILTKNCAGIVVDEPIRPFTWAAELLMLGSGVGYNIQKEYVYQLPKLKKKLKIERLDTSSADYIVPDTREGWVALLGRVLKAHFYKGEGFSYSTQLIRGKGAPIKGFGGTASGPEDLCWGINEINKILNARSNQKLRPIDCLDIMNIIGAIVVAGNVRRSAQIAIGDYDDLDFLRAKRWDLGSIPNWRSMSNNSVASPVDINHLPQEFWDTYEQGEPYGLINLRLSREIGRTGDTSHPDPNVVVYNPCVSGDTKILTNQGYVDIESLVGKQTSIWNGFEWSNVIPKITGYNQPMLKVTLSDGRELKCTDYHKWHLSNGYFSNKTNIVKAIDLRVGDKLIKHNLPVIQGGEHVGKEYAYTQGFFQGDGTSNTRDIFIYEPKFKVIPKLLGSLGSGEYTLKTGVKRKIFHMKGNYEGKDFVPHKWDVDSKISWLSGLLDADGCELKEGGCQLTSIDKNFLLEVQYALSTLGVQCKVLKSQEEGFRALPDGKGGSSEYFCQKGYRLCIGATCMQHLKGLGLDCARLSFEKFPNRDASQYIKIVSIERIENEEVVYCFNEPLRHTGIFNGVITGQCAEQSLHNMETCCLGELFLPNITSFKEFKKCLYYTYRMCKHSLTLKCSLIETEEVVHKNMRMGIGLTGILQASDEQRSWMNKGYEYLRKLDKEYSLENGFPESIKLTTCKPSGSLSLLPGVTPGIHPNPAGPYYIRRIRIASDSSLVDVCRSHGYEVEPQLGFDGTIDKSTMVVSFPCKLPETTPVAASFSWKKQLDNVRQIQREWSDNSVSCTVYYKKEDLPDIKKYLSKYFPTEMKTVSFLLYSGHGFKQAPYETITKDQYLKMTKNAKPITSVEIKDTDLEMVGCEGGACPIR